MEIAITLTTCYILSYMNEANLSPLNAALNLRQLSQVSYAAAAVSPSLMQGWQYWTRVSRVILDNSK